MSARSPLLLWWGRFDPGYARNRILRGLMRERGFRIRDFRPAVSAVGDLEAAARRLPAPALVWLPCFRQRDLAAALRFARRHGVPLVADPLISAYDKQVHERAKHAESSVAARRLRAWEGGLLRACDRVVADTDAHAAFFRETFDLDAHRVHVVHVGAEEALFAPTPVPATADGVEALFYGSFIGLQGPETIVAAARGCRAPRVRWTLLGDGPLRRRCETAGRGLPNLSFEPPVPYPELPARIHRAHLLLGVFGAGAKAGRVIPNKVYQSLACGRPLVTRRAAAYPAAMCASGSSGVQWVTPGDPAALAAAVAALAAHPERLAELGRRAATSYRRWLGNDCVGRELDALLASLGLVGGVTA